MGSPKVVLRVTMFLVAGVGLGAYLACALGAGGAASPEGTSVEIKAPLGLPPVPFPEDNPPTVEKIALGRRLYRDRILSVDNTVACADCHKPALRFTDGKQFSEGVGKKKAARNAPTVLNAAYLDFLFWDGRALSLEKQVEDPVQNPLEMANTLEAVEKKLTGNAGYRAAFEKAFGPGPITFDKVEKAIASFERTLISANSPFDRYFYGGEKTALAPAAQRGFSVFFETKKANCNACHSVYKRYPKVKAHVISAATIPEDESYALFSDGEFHNTGVGADPRGNYKDLGRYNVTHKEADKGAFKTPTLRNVAKTGPYMHDGSKKTLKDVIDFYVQGGNPNPHLDPKIRKLDFLTTQERADLLAFLESLTGAMPGLAEQTAEQLPESRVQRHPF